MTSYQKLKAENAALREDIRKLVEGSPGDMVATKLKWQTKFNLESALITGDSNGEIVGRVDGLLCMIKPHKQ